MKLRYIVQFKGMPKPIICPKFWELRWAYGCIWRPSCDYCYLRGTLFKLDQVKTISFEGYLKRKRVLEKELPIFFETMPPCALNSGELAESLMMELSKEPFIPWITKLFKQYARGHKHLVLTKGGVRHIQNLVNIEGQDVTIVSFSINPYKFAEKHERGAPKVSDRLEACKILYDLGYEVRLRIDFPLFTDADVIELIKDVYTHYDITPARWTLGVPRINNPRLWRLPFFKEFKPYMEHVGKNLWRLNRAYSESVYVAIVDTIRSYDSGEVADIALCKETEKMWEEVGLSPKECKCNCVL